MKEAYGDIVTSRYINPYTDFGFKKLFGSPLNKDLLISFLNALFDNKKDPIEDLTYISGEMLGRSPNDRRAIYDVSCKTKKGDTFIVEMQNNYQPYFKDRTLYYSSKTIVSQGETGDWDFNLTGVYVVAIQNFVYRVPTLDENGKLILKEDFTGPVVHRVRLYDESTGKVFSDKLQFIYIEMPKFNKKVDELDGTFDKWLYVLKNLATMNRPAELKDRIFKKLFREAEIAAYTPEEYAAYEESLKVYRDNKNTSDYAVYEAEVNGIAKGFSKGRAEGELQAKLALARSMKADNMPVEAIAKYTGLSLTEINNL